MDLAGQVLAGGVACLAAVAAAFRLREERAVRQTAMVSDLVRALVERVERLEEDRLEKGHRIELLQEQLASVRSDVARAECRAGTLERELTDLRARYEHLEENLQEVYRRLGIRGILRLKRGNHEPG